MTITLMLITLIAVGASYVFLSECVTVMADHLSSTIHSLISNSIGPEGAIAVAAAMKTANLRELQLVDLATIMLCPHVASYVFVSECVTVMVDHLPSSIHSLAGNSIGDEGAVAVAAAMTANLQMLR